MNIDTAHPSNYIKSAELQGREFALVMDHVEIKELDDTNGGKTKKPILYFANAQKGLVLNVVNSNTIKDAYGSETDDWNGKKIILYATKVEFGGKMVDGLRVRIPTNVKPAQPQRRVHADPAPSPARPPAPEPDDLGPTPQEGGDLAIDEEAIPF